MKATLLGLSLAACAGPASAQDDAQAQWVERCSDDSGWDDPGPPFKVYGNTWYVGTCGIAALLVTGDDGHVLIDTGTEKGAELVLANIRALGFDPADVAVLLASHEHHDHTGGMAAMQRATGARLLVSPRAAEAIRTGKASAEDPQHRLDQGMPPARVDGAVNDGAPVALGGLSLLPLDTPGHTPGATSWQWRACEDGECRTIVYADSLSAISDDTYRYSDHNAYVADFRRGLARLAQMKCDMLLTPHPSASGMRDRILSGGLADPEGCKAYAASRVEMLDARLAKESGE